MQFAKIALTILVAAPIFGNDGTPIAPARLLVHEWGTFTSVASESGAPQPWNSLVAKPDLPCFVYRLWGQPVKFIGVAPRSPAQEPVKVSMVRMETPVLYFYTPQTMNVSVQVDFPQGWITEWFPKASSVVPESKGSLNNLPQVGGGKIVWNSVQLLPARPVPPQTGFGASHYYAARNTDAVPLKASDQHERLLFYRGIANFPVPLWAKVVDDGTVELRNAGDATLPLAILFENRGGKIGYRVTRELTGAVTLPMPQLTADLDRLKKDLASALVDMGLYEKEAAAMLETWRDSWFEEGMRVFYLMPRRSVDHVLPLTIQPAPASTARAFVGRVEVLSPSMRQTLATALAAGDAAVLDRYGRFLEPFSERISGAKSNPATAKFFKGRYDDLAGEFNQPSCVQ